MAANPAVSIDINRDSATYQGRKIISGISDSETTGYVYNYMHMERREVIPVLHAKGLVVAVREESSFLEPGPDDLDLRPMERERTEDRGDVGATALYNRFARFYRDRKPFRIFLECDRETRVRLVQFAEPDSH